MDPFKIFGAATVVLIVLAMGCSPASSLPPDPSLSYEAVAKNPAEYGGKRVRWSGQFAKGTAKDRWFGRGSSIDAVFVDTSTDFRVTVRAFAVEANSPKDKISFMFDLQGKPLMVTGTVAGTRKVTITVGPPPTDEELEVPLLRDAQFEEEQPSPGK